jgi:hypothetical protein
MAGLSKALKEKKKGNPHWSGAGWLFPGSGNRVLEQEDKVDLIWQDKEKATLPQALEVKDFTWSHEVWSTNCCEHLSSRVVKDLQNNKVAKLENVFGVL